MAAAPPRSRWRIVLGLVAAGVLTLALLFTSAAPWVPEMRNATGEQVAAARALAEAARESRKTGEPVELELGERELDAISAMMTQGFAPYRFDAALDDGVLTLTGSRKLLFRWVNIRAQARGDSEGIPDFAVRIGSVPLPDWLSRWGIEALERRLGGEADGLPPIDTIVRSTSIGAERLTAQVAVPQGSLLAHARATGAPTLDEDAIAAIYCRMSRQQRSDPSTLLTQQLRRALAEAEPTPEGHGAALVALALFTVGPEATELAGDGAALEPCVVAKPKVTLQGREDWAKHWALSAALETAAGSGISAAIGEWKELADTLAKDPLLAPKDPSGFSFVDLASDRAGMMTARKLGDPARLADARKELLTASEDDLLPAAALSLSDGLTDAEFAARYGATDDPRFGRKVEAIDAMLRRGGID